VHDLPPGGRASRRRTRAGSADGRLHFSLKMPVSASLKSRFRAQRAAPGPRALPLQERVPGLTGTRERAMIGWYQSTSAAVSFPGVERYSRCKVIDPSIDPEPWSPGADVTVPGWSCGPGWGIAIVLTTPQGDTTISMPSRYAGAAAVLAWIETGTPQAYDITEKQIVRRALLPAYHLFVPNTSSLTMAGMMHGAVNPCAGRRNSCLARMKR
jgi:hypothetical protein